MEMFGTNITGKDAGLAAGFALSPIGGAYAKNIVAGKEAQKEAGLVVKKVKPEPRVVEKLEEESND